MTQYNVTINHELPTTYRGGGFVRSLVALSHPYSHKVVHTPTTDYLLNRRLASYFS